MLVAIFAAFFDHEILMKYAINSFLTTGTESRNQIMLPARHNKTVKLQMLTIKEKNYIFNNMQAVSEYMLNLCFYTALSNV